MAAGTHALTAVHLFSADADDADGVAPEEGVTLAANGELYGTTNYGGIDDFGTLFTVSPGGGQFQTLASLADTVGIVPSPLISNASGDVFGTTAVGDPSQGQGTIFEVSTSSNAISVVASLESSGTAGIDPEGGLAADSAGNLFGTTVGNGAGWSSKSPAQASRTRYHRR